MLDLEQELQALIDALNAASIEYALCGGLALAVGTGSSRSRAQDQADIERLRNPE